jgi:phosphoribosyl 1,2-cyclic phosphodiesterase
VQFASLGSGSKGNATLVRAGDTLVMIDCGFSMRETGRRMAQLGVSPEQLSAILVTHEHTDHSSGVAALSRKFAIPVYLTHGTHSTGRCDGCHQVERFNCEDQFTIGSLAVQAVAVPHDAAEPCQYTLAWQGRRLGVLTDLGSVTPHVLERFSDCHGLLIEFNHDLPMLMAGPYPAHLKRRVAGDWGHLNNHQSASLLESLDHAALKHIVVAHISEKNNSQARAEEALLAALGSLDRVVFAAQRSGFDWLDVS